MADEVFNTQMYLTGFVTRCRTGVGCGGATLVALEAARHLDATIILKRY